MGLSKQEFDDLQFLECVARNTVRIEAAQRLLDQVSHKDLNTNLKDAMRLLELARQTNHSMYCTTSDRVFR
jgi:hypothetical protein